MENLLTIVKGTKAKLTHVCNGKIYFQIDTEKHKYQLEVDSTEDLSKMTYFVNEYKTIVLMRWIRKGLKNETFIQLI